MLVMTYVVYITVKILRWHQFLKGASRYHVSKELLKLTSLCISWDK